MVLGEADLRSNLQTFDLNDVTVDTPNKLLPDHLSMPETMKNSIMSTHQQSRSITPSYAYGYGELSSRGGTSFANRSTFKTVRSRHRHNQSVRTQMSPSRKCIEDYIQSSKEAPRFNQGSRRRNIQIKNNFMVPPSSLPANYVFKPAQGPKSNTPILKYIKQQ